MRGVVQRVTKAQVRVLEGETSYISGEIHQGLLVFLGVTHEDTQKDAEYIADKLLGLRIFEDEEEKMNRSVMEVGGGILLVSQFTLYGSVVKGKRPSFTQAAPPAMAQELYQYTAKLLENAGCFVQRGVFRATMEVSLTNDGPVTILMDSTKLF